jgi:hypothetical protein
MGTVATITSGTTAMSTAATELNKIVNAQNSVGQYSSNTSTTLTTTIPAAVAFDTNDAQAGTLTHSTTTNTSRFTTTASGIYRFTAQVQFNHLTTGTGQALSYFRKNGTAEVVNSTARMSANGVTDTGVLVVDCLISMVSSDYIELMVATTVASEWAITQTAASGTSPNVIPNTPAVILTVTAYPA